MLRYYEISLLTFVFCGGTCFFTYAQKKDSMHSASIKGIVIDSVHHSILQYASVAVYKTKDSGLINYTLTNNFGEFSVAKLPYDMTLYLIVSHPGYVSTFKAIFLKKNAPVSNLKEINIKRTEKIYALKEVIVKAVAPVQMHGDTLEFNAEAFTLDKNAVVEDLMRKLPGITLWSDGQITINGKKVSQVFVEGKPFFGGKAKIALQNLPKESVDKIQVYNAENKESLSDSLVNVNIKLKKNKKRGAFGKLSVEIGTSARHGLDGMLNMFNTRTQLGIVASANNTNKKAKDVSTLVEYNSFKGVGINIDYQPDFTMQGISNSLALGAIYQHDFISDPSFYKNNRLLGNFFYNKIKTTTINNSMTTTATGDNSILLQKNNSQVLNEQSTNKLDLNYNKKTRHLDMSIYPALLINNGSNYNTSTTEVKGNKDSILSSNYYMNDNQYRNHEFELKTDIKANLDQNKPKSAIDFLSVLGDSVYKSSRSVFSKLTSENKELNSQLLDRKYYTDLEKMGGRFNLNLNGFANTIFNKANFWGINIGLQNRFAFNEERQQNRVLDKDTITGNFAVNNYLTNKYTYNIIVYAPALNLSKEYSRILADRYRKVFASKISMGVEFTNQKNSSDHVFQNFKHNYSSFLPSIALSYSDHQYGVYQKNCTFTYTTKVDVPTIQQIAPLIDSSNVYLFQIGNSSISKQYTHSLSLSFNSSTEKSKNNFSYIITARANFVKDKMVDNTTYDNIGRSIVYQVNANGYKSFNGSVFFQKALRYSNDNSFQFVLSSSVNFSRAPNFINLRSNISNQLSNSTLLNVYYALGDVFAFSVSQSLSYSHLHQSGIISDFSNKTFVTSLGSSYKFLKYFSMTSNIDFNKNLNSTSQPVQFIIWNASLIARFVKGNNGEIKISALDLLRQNKGIINYAANNSITTGEVNVLKYYYTLSLAYYPRFFGKHPTKTVHTPFNSNPEFFR